MYHGSPPGGRARRRNMLQRIGLALVLLGALQAVLLFRPFLSEGQYPESFIARGH